MRAAVVAALHEIADADEMAADPAGDRRQHVGELDIELGGLQRAFGHGLGGVRRLQGLAALVDDLFGDRTGLDQGQAAVEVALGELRLGARIGELAVGLLGDRLERAGIDHVKQVAGMDHVAVLELDIGDEAADPGTDLDLFDRVEPAGEFVPVGDGALDRLRHRDRRRRSGGGLRRLFAAGRQRDGDQDDERQGTKTRGH